MITLKVKTAIVDSMVLDRINYTSDSKHSLVLGINKSQYNRIKNGDLDRVISDAKWIILARLLSVKLNNSRDWVTVKTEVYNYITTQLKACQERSISVILCDISGIGKTHTAKHYVKQSQDAIYIDCSQVKSKQKLIRKMAREFGIGFTGRYADAYEDLVFYIRTLTTPLIILDEAGDLDYTAFLELKALWNAVEYSCGWYMMGADGLKHKITKQKDLKKVGYTELLDRYGNDYKRVTPIGSDALQEFHCGQIDLVSRANKSNIPTRQMYARTYGSLRKVRTEIEKQQIC